MINKILIVLLLTFTTIVSAADSEEVFKNNISDNIAFQTFRAQMFSVKGFVAGKGFIVSVLCSMLKNKASISGRIDRVVKSPDYCRQFRKLNNIGSGVEFVSEKDFRFAKTGGFRKWEMPIGKIPIAEPANKSTTVKPTDSTVDYTMADKFSNLIRSLSAEKTNSKKLNKRIAAVEEKSQDIDETISLLKLEVASSSSKTAVAITAAENRLGDKVAKSVKAGIDTFKTGFTTAQDTRFSNFQNSINGDIDTVKDKAGYWWMAPLALFLVVALAIVGFLTVLFGSKKITKVSIDTKKAVETVRVDIASVKKAVEDLSSYNFPEDEVSLAAVRKLKEDGLDCITLKLTAKDGGEKMLLEIARIDFVRVVIRGILAQPGSRTMTECGANHVISAIKKADRSSLGRIVGVPASASDSQKSKVTTSESSPANSVETPVVKENAKATVDTGVATVSPKPAVVVKKQQSFKVESADLNSMVNRLAASSVSK